MRSILIFLISASAIVTSPKATVTKSTPLHQAVYKSTNMLTSLLKSVTDLNVLNAKNQTPLHVAVSVDNYEGSERLIKAGANVDSEDEMKASPLMYATCTVNLRLVNLLLRNGANVNHKNSRGIVSLHIAAKRGSVEILKALMFNSGGNIKVNLTDNLGLTAFHFAATEGHVDIIEILSYTEAYGNLEERRNKRTAIHMAVIENKTECALYLLNFVKTDVKDRYGKSCAHYAAQLGRKIILISLISAGLDLECRDGDGNTLLLNAVDLVKKRDVADHLLACRRSAEIVKILILAGADLKAVNYAGKNAIDLAAENENYAAHYVITTEMTIRSSRKIIREYASPLHYEITETTPPDLERIRSLISTDLYDHLGRSAVYLAVAKGNLEIVDELISAKCDLTLKDAIGNNPLHLAKNADMARRLLRANPDLANLVNDEGNIPLHVAVLNQREGVVSVLVGATSNLGAYNMKGRCPLDIAVKLGNIRMAKCLLNFGAGKKIKAGVSGPLHFAAGKGDFEMANLLLKNGLNAAHRNQVGGLPVIDAVFFGRCLNMIRILMRGLEPDITDIFGYSLLHFAAISVERTESVARMLIDEYEVPVNLKSYRGRTALHMAASRGNSDVVRVLIDGGADAFMTTPRGTTALAAAVRYGAVQCVAIITNANRDLLHFARSGGFTPVEALLTYGKEMAKPKGIVVAMELTPEDAYESVLKVLAFMSNSFAVYVEGLTEPITFKDYIERGIEDFKRENEANIDDDVMESFHFKGLGIFYAFAAAHYPKLISMEKPETETEKLYRKLEEYRNAVKAFEKVKKKMVYFSELRCMLVDSFMSEKGRRRLLNTYMDTVPLELVDDILVGVTNNSDVRGRIALMANSLMLTLKSREELERCRGYFRRKMAALSEFIIPK